MRESEAKGSVEVLKVRSVNLTHRGFLYLTEVQRVVVNFRWMAAFHLPAHLTE